MRLRRHHGRPEDHDTHLCTSCFASLLVPDGEVLTCPGCAWKASRGPIDVPVDDTAAA